MTGRAERPVVEECRRAWALARRPFRRASSISCDEVAEHLQQVLDAGGKAPHGVVAHVEYCLRCQAEVARYRKLLRLLHQLRSTDIPVPNGIVSDVLSTIESVAGRHAVRSLLSGRRVAYSAAVVAAASTGLLLVARGRIGRPRHSAQSVSA